ncbi:molybdenum cofactor biosynthesis protein B [Kordiimonas aquimaris]|uniref:molybdenum cofactor biosynthesis protein B n=1 Tax=Kordiimonas aquimaris TaxID=707591 RepID=UPI0021D329C5|nr:molybdenum cofactor biosynthesis protein B [Kordiimonas aquimaris]
MIDETRDFIPVKFGIATISDTRTFADDKSGDTLAARIETAGHIIQERKIIKDDKPSITAQLNAWINSDEIQVIVSTGGTGITGRDVTPECFEALYTKSIPGFGELFRMLSYDLIGTSTIQSRATGGIAGTTLMFALPGSTGAVKDGWDKILVTQLDSRFRPCNFVELMPRFGEK